MSIRRPLAGFVALGLIVAACSGSASSAPSTAPSVASLAPPSAAASPTPTRTPTPTVEITPAPSPVVLSITAHVWWGGYAIDVTGATYDPLKHKLNIAATFLNTSTSDNDVTRLGNELNVVWNNTYLPGYIPSGAVPAGGTVQAEIQVQPPAAFTPDTAVLTFGKPDEHQATVPLNGGAAASEQPTKLTVSGVVKMGKFVTFTLTSGIVIPASCAGYSNKIKYGPIKKDEVSIVLAGVGTNSEPRNDGLIDQGFITVPDGTTSASNPVVSVYLASKATLRDQGMCFNVPSPGSGSYKLTMHESRSKANGSVTFVVP